MSDHQNYCNIFTHESVSTQDIGDFSNDSESIIVDKKNGEDFLIKLFREQSFLYDKNNPNFKNTLMKQNAWNEISKAMIEANCGDFYTPDYCQKRCTSLRDQYNREKKKIENQPGSAASTPNSRQFYSQLTFLDKVIKRRRRRTYSNVIRSQSMAASDKRTKTCKSNNVSVSSSSNTEDQHTNPEQTAVGMIVMYSPKLKRREMDDSKQLEQTFLNMSNRIMDCMENPKLPTADDAFMEFIKIQFASVPEHEKNIRRKLIIDAISAPLPET